MSCRAALLLWTGLRELVWFGRAAWLLGAAGLLIIAVGCVAGLRFPIDEDRDSNRTTVIVNLANIVALIIVMVLEILIRLL